MIELKNLTIGYNKYEPIVKDLNYTFKDNMIYGIIGESGIGKSTMLKTIAGLLKPINGEVLKDGKQIKNAGKEDIYMMFQNYTCFDWLTCLDNVTIAKRIKGSISDEDINDAKRRLIDVGLEERMSYYPTQLSGGQKQRLALARTLFMNPYAVLMDEPLSALDEKTRSEMQSLIVKDHETDKNIIIMITHSTDEAKRMCNKILEFTNGGLKEWDSKIYS